MATSLRHLTAFLQAGAALPFAWGSCDCCLWACDWVLARRGVDPAARLRGRYHSARGARRQMRRVGSLHALVAGEMLAAGLRETWLPEPGDVGLVETPSGPAMAIRTGLGWAVKGERGIVTRPYPLLQAWAV